MQMAPRAKRAEHLHAIKYRRALAMNFRRRTTAILSLGATCALVLSCSAGGSNGDSAFGGVRGGGAGGGSGNAAGAAGVNGGNAGAGGAGQAGAGGSGASGAKGGSGGNSASNAGAGGGASGSGGSGGTGGAGAGGAGQGGAGAGGTGGSGGGGGDGGTGGCGTRSGMRGKTSRTVTVGSAMRTYIAYLPMSASPTEPLPFVYVFHGATQTGQNLYDITQYAALADTEGIAVVFPDGQSTSSASGTGSLDPWSVSDNGAAVCGAGSLVSNPNAVDFAFVDAIKMDMMQDQCLDAAHTFATGFSMGGYFTHHIACDRTDFRAAGPASGGTLASLSSCKTAHVPIIIFHGTSDGLIAPGCDDPNSPAQSGFPPSATLWAQKNGCKTTYATIAENGSSGSDGQCYLYDGCPSDGQVELCTFTGMPHAWAGAAQCPGCIGSGASYASATALEWAFFKKYAW